ncbi:MAG: flippase-like domain-containing protein [Candidatus Obscuribacterales bacterium]|nr:flippase-like domain-containing protein [Candidatus Obscuribacterales bacterium]
MESTGLNKQPWHKQVLKQIIGIGIAGIFLYFAFRGTNFEQLLSYTHNLNLFDLVVVFSTSVLSHLLRAYRWTILLAPLSERKISLWNSFCAVIYGYAVNIVLPRGGEIARLVSISKTENIPWVGVLPTMFIDRLLDVAMLVLLLGTSILLLPLGEMNAPWLIPAGVGMCLSTIAGLILLPFGGRIMRFVLSRSLMLKTVPVAIAAKINELSLQFDQGTKCLVDVLNLPKIAFLSFAIWGLYWANFYFMLRAFHLTGQVGMDKSLVIFTIGSVGVLVPTPGSVGSYHFLVSQGLQKLAGINGDQSLAFATVLHIFCFILATCIPAALCFIGQSLFVAKNKGDELVK